MMASKLSNALVSPSKVANILDWRKAMGVVMGLDITRERIGVALAEHPDLRGPCATRGPESFPLDSISLRQDRNGALCKKSQVNEDLVSELEAVVKQHRVCAFVVNWPIQEGRTGEQCGKVLQVLDAVIDKSNCVVTSKRPFALWCNYANASNDSSPPDEWGRSTCYTQLRDYTPGMSYSSKSAIRRESSANASMVAANVLHDWVENHWAMGIKAKASTMKKKDFFFNTYLVNEFNSEQAVLQAALL
mmetsp:Transcript_7150/g.15488  ORF Transcript_7150/g.15488 Transcript_7150/m.15488 type:complete len:247 (-) Transcript_7150:129-869(-)